MGNKIDYYCPQCGDEVWAYSSFQGNTCWGCKFSKPLVDKGHWYNLMHKRATYNTKNLQNYYSSENTIKMGDITFHNVLPKKRWNNLSSYRIIQDTYVCGLNAVNMALKFWDYQNQMTKAQYSHNSVFGLKWGLSEKKFYNQVIDKVFRYGGYRSHDYTINFQWDYIDDTDYTKYSIIALGGYGLGAHYFLIIGVDSQKQYYLITDQSESIWVARVKLMRTACLYANTGYQQHSLYRVG